MSVSGGCCAVVGSGGGSRGAKPRVGGCALCWVGLGSVVVGLGSLVWWASVSVSGGCCVVLCGGGGGRGAKPRVGGCALGVGRCVFRGLGQDFAKMVHFRPSENLENNFRQHVVLLEYLPTRYCFWKLFRTFAGKMTRGLSLRMVFSLLFQDTLFRYGPLLSLISPPRPRFCSADLPNPFRSTLRRGQPSTCY